MKLKYTYFLFSLAIFTGCSKVSSDNIVTPDTIPTKVIEHFNIVFAPDLSNRIINETRPKPVDDTQIINDFLENIETVLTHKRTQNQYDRYSFDFINKNLISRFDVNLDYMKIDFSVFENRQIERIDYLRNRSENTISKDLKDFELELERVYSSAKKDNYGADIYSYLNSLSKQSIGKELNSFEFQNVLYKGVYKNVLLIFTDGYIEAGLYGKDSCKSGNLCYYLSSNKIKEFRDAFEKSNESSLEEFFKKGGFGLVPIDNEYLKEFEVLVLEVNDRSLDVAGNASIHPTDFQILNLFWSDWLEKSGVKNYQILPISPSREKAKENIFDFLGID